MKMIKQSMLSILMWVGCCLTTLAEPVFYANQVAYDTRSPKTAVLGLDEPLNSKQQFNIVDTKTLKIVYVNILAKPQQVIDWDVKKIFYQADFSAFVLPGNYKLSVNIGGKQYFSYPFDVDDNALAKQTIPAILHYLRKQRANTPIERANDQHIPLYGSDKTVDLRGGWCDASGDVSKYFSHLAYANFVSPQQIPLVTWSMESVEETIPGLLTKWGLKDSLENEA